MRRPWANMLNILPKSLTKRFIAQDQKTVLVTGRMPDLNAANLLPVVNVIDKQLRLLRVAHPDYQLSVTGLPAIAARNSAAMIDELGFGLMSTIAIVVALIAVVFRSFFAALASIIPNLFPIFAAGGILYMMGHGLQFSSAVALTVAFWLAVNDTIHFLHRLHLERRGRSQGFCHSHGQADGTGTHFDNHRVGAGVSNDSLFWLAKSAYVWLAFCNYAVGSPTWRSFFITRVLQS